MIKILLVGATLVAASTGVAIAQGAVLPGDLPRGNAPSGGGGVRSGNITPTGETVPNPGASQSAGTTSLDRGIERENDKIQGSICKDC